MITIPEVLTKPLDEIKSASTRILIIVLILVIGYLSNQIRELRKEIADLHAVVDAGKKDALTKSEAENIRLRAQVVFQDSVKQVLQILIETKRR